MAESIAFRRGDVILAPLPFATDPSRNRIRPAVIIQNDIGNQFSPNLIVAMITSQLPARPYPTDLVVRLGSPQAAGTMLDRDSVVQTAVIVTIPKDAVMQRLGRFNERAMIAIDGCIRASLGLT